MKQNYTPNDINRQERKAGSSKHRSQWTHVFLCGHIYNIHVQRPYCKAKCLFRINSWFLIQNSIIRHSFDMKEGANIRFGEGEVRRLVEGYIGYNNSKRHMSIRAELINTSNLRPKFDRNLLNLKWLFETWNTIRFLFNICYQKIIGISFSWVWWQTIKLLTIWAITGLLKFSSGINLFAVIC